jgi:hypothetical protein
MSPPARIRVAAEVEAKAAANLRTAATTGTSAVIVTRDNDGAAVAGAIVTARRAGVVKASATSGADGTYQIANLAPALMIFRSRPQATNRRRRTA